MTQLVLDTANENGIILPESQKGGYTVELAPLSVDVEMISGRLVRELRGRVWKISYQYGYFADDMKNMVIATCRKGQREPIECLFLPPDSAELSMGRFWVVEFNYPRFFWSRDDNGSSIPMWADFSIALREVKPSD